MHRITRFRPTPATVIASIALLVALGGTSVAAVNALAPPNSVGTAAVIDYSLLKKDFKEGQLPAGAPGSALAYAHIDRDGLDVANSKNVALVPTDVSSQAKSGTYCLDVRTKQAPRNAIATLAEAAVPGASAFGQIAVDMRASVVGSDCAGNADAVVTTKIENGDFVPRDFYIVFN